ncbi:MAG TPA: hypothetical protein VGM90_17185 [Kofleriaceae bacterium]|jgi:hypothetical protein
MQTKAWLSVGFAALASLAACGSDDSGPRKDKPTAPADNDPSYAVTGVEAWYVIDNEATNLDQTMTAYVTAPDGTDTIDAYVADLPVQRLTKQPDGRFALQISVADVPAGAQQVLFSANGDTTAFAAMPFNRSSPYYVLVTTDWDFSDPGANAIHYQDELHQFHPEIRITHFVGPYTFTDPVVTPARQQELVTWLLKQKTDHDDEIGLHIHPYCNFVEDAGVTCITDQSTVYTTDASGYTIKLGAYSHQDVSTLFEHAKTLFMQHGLPEPHTFRAGGWTATLDTLAALSEHGFVADTSALNWARIEEWQGKELYRWCMENWNPIGDTSQPYYPSQSNVLASGDVDLPILEIPDNGVMIDYVSLQEMNGIFDANWNGTDVMDSPRTLMMGFHPSTTFSQDEYDRVNHFLEYADMHLASKHDGPVVYITMSDIVTAYP